jgi:SAM-dependent methyltransferase
MDLKKQLLIARGTIKHLPFLKNFHLPQSTGGTIESRYCYSVWMRHLVNSYRFLGRIPQNVAELGPGDSLGTGFAALLSGSKSIFALDVIKYWDNERNLRIFDELVKLFRDRTPIPDNTEYPKVRPVLNDFNFPAHIFTDEMLKKSLSCERLASIRKEIADIDNPSNIFIRYKIPWNDAGIIQEDSVDFIYSQAVLESVEEPDRAYGAMDRWLKPGGIMSHTIDFRSHGLTKDWNGHWVFNDLEWKLVKGNRSFLINRLPLSAHMLLHSGNGFIILYKESVITGNMIDRKALAERFRALSDEDLTTSGCYIISKKPEIYI